MLTRPGDPNALWCADYKGEFLLGNLRRDDGRWLRSWQRDGGARHLAAQTASPHRWRQFLAWLEGADLPVAQAASAARDVFGLALRAYGVKALA